MECEVSAWNECLARSEAVDDVRGRFERACARFEEFEHVTGNPKFNPDENLDKEIELFHKAISLDRNSAEFRALARENNDAFKKVVDKITYNDVLKDADAIYGEILSCAKYIYNHLKDFGVEKKYLRVLVCDMGEIKEEIDALKDFNEDNAGKEIYPTSVRVEPITEKKALYRYFRSKK